MNQPPVTPRRDQSDSPDSALGSLQHYESVPTQRPKFFISHAHVESDQIRTSLEAPLKQHGFDALLFRTNPAIDPMLMTDRIRASMRGCTHVLVAVSQAAAKSGWVRGEVREAIECLPPERVVPILFAERLKPTIIHPWLNSPGLDFIRDPTLGITALVEYLKLHRYAQSAIPAKPHSARQKKTKRYPSPRHDPPLRSSTPSQATVVTTNRSGRFY